MVLVILNMKDVKLLLSAMFVLNVVFVQDLNFIMTLYMKQGQEAYNFEGYSKPSSDSYLNINSIGELRINANYDTGSDNKIYLKDNSATLYYKMIIPSEIRDTDGYVYDIYDDSTEKILDYTIGHVKSGALLILKSYDDGSN